MINRKNYTSEEGKEAKVQLMSETEMDARLLADYLLEFNTYRDVVLLRPMLSFDLVQRSRLFRQYLVPSCGQASSQLSR